MRKVCILTALAGVLLLAVACSSTLAVGYLKIHPSNPHYFQENGTGRPILIATVGSIVPSDTNFDYTADIAQMGQRRISYARVWHFLPWAGSTAIWPWGRSGTGGAPMGGNKIDMNSWNSTYWTRMTDSLSKANTVGTYAEIHLFDRCGLSPSSSTRYEGNPWASDNNINSLEMPTAVGNDGTPEFYQWSSRSNLKYQQERYIKKMIDETISYTNAFYEIENEHWQSDSSGWADHYGQFVKDYIAANYSSSPRLTSYSSIESDSDLDQCYTMSAIDIVNRHYGNELENDPSIVNDYLEDRWGYDKPMNIDEFANDLTDPDVLREICWTIVTSGGHFSISDATPPARPFDICENIRSFMALSGWNFIAASPDSSLVASGAGYCMKQTGVEYVCYFPTGGNKTVNIASGSYREEWWDPVTGGFYNVSNFSHGGGNRSFSCPDGNDWVLHVTTTAAPTTVLNSKSAGAITIDGATTDWNLGEFTTKIAGGNVGTGDTGVVEFDTDGVCYTGGHFDGWQVLPSSATDHSVKLYSRNDASYLYLLMRVTDNDMQYGSPTSSNWSNDCVEIYIDPSHNGGATGISASTSDIQLVIDANNQKNVYSTTSGYATQVLNGVTSAVVRDGTGWWLEARISKSALDPDIPATGTIGIDFGFRDNDNNNDTALSSVTSWREPEVSGAFPSKIPDRWGDMNLQGTPDTTPPANVSSFAATAGTGQIALTWTNPSDTDYTGVMIRFKTTGYPTSTTDGSLAVDDSGSPGSADNFTHTNLTAGVTYYYKAFSHDGVPNYASGVTSSAVPTAPTVTTINVKSAANLNLVIDGSSSDWTLTDFTTKVRGGEQVTGDYGIVGFDGGTCYYGGYNTSFVLPTNAADHTGKVYSRHDQQYQYFLVRCDDAGMNYAQPTSANWANDCIEFYIDPSHDHGSSQMSNSTSDLQLVIDANNQKNVYSTTSGYATQVLNGVTSAVVRDGTGWWLEVKILKTAIDPDLPASGSFGVDFMFRDNDNPDATYFYGSPTTSTFYGWRDNGTGTGYCAKIPNAWGDAALATLSADTTPPASVTSFTATAGSSQVSLSWTNPQTADWTGTMVRFKTGSYPTGVTDGTQIYNGTGTSYLHTSLTAGVTYYYCAYAYDEVPNYASAAQASAIPTSGPTVSTLNVKDASNLNLAIDGSSSDWSLGSFTTKSLGGQNTAGDIAITGFDNSVLYYGGYCNSGFVLPTNAADHTAKVYGSHDSQYQYFLIRCDDNDMRYSNPASSNWGNDCVEFYIDPGHDHGATGISNSTSDLQLVIDANNQKNVYMTTTGYATQVLNGVTSAVVRDGTGWWLEVKILKSALDPDMPASGSFGVDFAFRDNDNNNDPTLTTAYGWRDNTVGATYPSKVPDKWGDASLATLTSDTTAPASVTGFSATGASLSVNLSWTNPGTADFAGTKIMFKTTGYPTSATDGTQVYSGTGTSTSHTGLTAGVTYYYGAYAFDEVPNYATAAQASAVPSAGGPVTISNSTFDTSSNGWTIATWKAGPHSVGTMSWLSSGAGNPGGGMRSTGSGSTDNDDTCTREGGEIYKVISTAGYSNISVQYDLDVNTLGGNYTGAGSGSCTADHSLVDEQLTVYYSTNGGTNWTQAEYTLRGTLLASYQSWGTRTINLSGVSACNNNANFAVRFRWQFNTSSDQGNLDNIKVIAN